MRFFEHEQTSLDDDYFAYIVSCSHLPGNITSIWAIDAPEAPEIRLPP